MASSAAVRFVPGAKKSTTLGFLQIQLRVNPGAGKNREGIGSVNNNTVELCVAARPRDGEANKAVISVLSSVLGVPKSRLILSHGLKSRDKIAVVNDIEGNGQEYAARVLALLREESTGGRLWLGINGIMSRAQCKSLVDYVRNQAINICVEYHTAVPDKVAMQGMLTSAPPHLPMPVLS